MDQALTKLLVNKLEDTSLKELESFYDDAIQGKIENSEIRV